MKTYFTIEIPENAIGKGEWKALANNDAFTNELLGVFKKHLGVKAAPTAIKVIESNTLPTGNVLANFEVTVGA